MLISILRSTYLSVGGKKKKEEEIELSTSSSNDYHLDINYAGMVSVTRNIRRKEYELV